MALLLTCRITLGDYVFSAANGVELESGWASLGDTGTLKMFGYANIEQPDHTLKYTPLEQVITVGTPVEIELGYDGQLRTEFKGYVAEVKTKVPLELRLEDEVFHLKRQPVSRTWRDVSLAQLLQELVPTVRLSDSIPKLHIDSLRADRTTVAGVLAKLKSDYLICAYFRNGTLFVGLPYTEFTSANLGIDGVEAFYSIQQNVVSDDLSYRAKEDVRIKVKVVAMHRNGKKTTVTDIGDPDGEERTLTKRTETTDKEELRKLALAEIAKYKYDGYTGSFTAFGEPYIMHSGVVDLVDKLRPQRNGRYLVNSVKTTFGPDGFRRVVELGAKASY